MVPEPDFEWHETSLDADGARPVRAISWRAIAVGALLCALIIAGVATVPPWLTSRATSATAHPPHPAGSTTSGGATGVVTSLGSTGLPPGWHPITPAGAHAIARAHSDPSVVVACGTTDGLSVFFRSSQTGGASWQSARTIGKGNQCTITIDPLHAENIALMLSINGSDSAQCYRSFDGGTTWQRESLPDGADFAGGMVWLDDAFFANRSTGPFTNDSPSRPHQLSRSLVGGPFTWVDGDAGFSGMQAITISLDGAVRDALYLTLTMSNRAGAFTIMHVFSRDKGRTWHTFIFSDIHGRTINDFFASVGSDTLLGSTDQAIYRSADGGQTWTAYPDLPTGISVNIASEYLAPDDTLVTQFIAPGQSDPGYQIYRAQVRGTGWQPLAPQTRDFPLVGIDWDAQGHLTTLYGRDTTDALVAYTL